LFTCAWRGIVEWGGLQGGVGERKLGKGSKAYITSQGELEENLFRGEKVGCGKEKSKKKGKKLKVLESKNESSEKAGSVKDAREG